MMLNVGKFVMLTRPESYPDIGTNVSSGAKLKFLILKAVKVINIESPS